MLKVCFFSDNGVRLLAHLHQVQGDQIVLAYPWVQESHVVQIHLGHQQVPALLEGPAWVKLKVMM